MDCVRFVRTNPGVTIFKRNGSPASAANPGDRAHSELRGSRIRHWRHERRRKTVEGCEREKFGGETAPAQRCCTKLNVACKNLILNKLLVETVGVEPSDVWTARTNQST
jgi:hypothetical protein